MDTVFAPGPEVHGFESHHWYPMWGMYVRGYMETLHSVPNSAPRDVPSDGGAGSVGL